MLSCAPVRQTDGHRICLKSCGVAPKLYIFFSNKIYIKHCLDDRLLKFFPNIFLVLFNHALLQPPFITSVIKWQQNYFDEHELKTLFRIQFNKLLYKMWIYRFFVFVARDNWQCRRIFYDFLFNILTILHILYCPQNKFQSSDFKIISPIYNSYEKKTWTFDSMLRQSIQVFYAEVRIDWRHFTVGEIN